MSRNQPTSSALSDVNSSDDAIAITPNDSTVFTIKPRALYVGTSGDVAVMTLRGTDITFKNVQNGGYIMQRVQKVYSTNTTAQDIVGMI